jgi:XTP/dITP diphosphohydrolase
VAGARVDGLDPEAELRRAALAYADRVRAAERENVGPAE